MKYWKKLSHAEQDKRITEALLCNVDYRQKISLGIPASKLDPQVFYDQATFLKDAPLLRAYVQNPNHIGCHTLGDSEEFFKGTQELEKEVIELVSVDMLKATPESCDGYVAAGGTEANIQAVWVYRNYFINKHDAKPEDIALLSSDDTHYSVAKAANLLQIKRYSVSVIDDTRAINEAELDKVVKLARAEGAKYFIVISNMATTMFGSVDDPNMYVQCLQDNGVDFKLHLDGAFGGFIYPVSDAASQVNFSNPHVSSVTLDAHKMLQAPYGTGIFVIRKGLIENVYTREAQYVNGMDITLSGSRSGANAVAIWMILMTYGYYGWLEKINKLLYRTDVACSELKDMGVPYYRNPRMNIITMRASYVSPALARQYGLVPDTHEGSIGWYKIVVMDHVEMEHLLEFTNELRKELKAKEAMA